MAMDQTEYFNKNMASEVEPVHFRVGHPTRLCQFPEDQNYKSDFRSISLFILFWITVLVLSPTYVWTLVLIIQWSLALPFMIINKPLIIQLFSLAIGCGCVPNAFFFRHRQQGTGKRYICVKVIYSIVCVLAITLSISAILLIDVYKQHSFVWNEYKDATDAAFKQGMFPTWTTDVFGKDCCGWNDGFDFGQAFNITPFLDAGDTKAMEKVSTCYNELFQVTINTAPSIGEKLTFGPKMSLSELPPGCSEGILTKTRNTCYFIAFSTIANIGLITCTLLVYIIPSYRGSQIRNLTESPTTATSTVIQTVLPRKETI